MAVVVDRGIDRDVDIGAAVAFLADDEEFLGQLFVHRFHITDSALIVKARAASRRRGLSRTTRFGARRRIVRSQTAGKGDRDGRRRRARGRLPVRPSALPGARATDQRANLPLPAVPEGDERALLRSRALPDRSGNGDGKDRAVRVVARALASLLPDLWYAAIRQAAERIARRHRSRGVRRSECAAAGVPLLRVGQDRLGAPQRRPAAISGVAARLDRRAEGTLAGSGLILANPPFPLERELQVLLPALRVAH